MCFFISFYFFYPVIDVVREYLCQKKGQIFVFRLTQHLAFIRTLLVQNGVFEVLDCYLVLQNLLFTDSSVITDVVNRETRV